MNAKITCQLAAVLIRTLVRALQSGAVTGEFGLGLIHLRPLFTP